MIRRPPRSTPFPTRRSSDQWVVEQETGAIDIAKNKIREGDIAKYRNANYQREVFEWQYGVVVFKNCGFELYNPIKDTTESLTDISISFLKIEVVGNIHENHELLEEKWKLPQQPYLTLAVAH